ncbi:hypothetical protein E8E11_011622 [Didymella keratinophila]|nr:hypothetical protein E8E11_011622 [Didymella keratinophila]
MAIHSNYREIKVEVVVNKKALQEHEDEETAPEHDILTRYVEAISGADFQIKIEVQPLKSREPLDMEFTLDGKMINRHYIAATNQQVKRTFGKAWDRVGDRWFSSKICFSEVSRTSEETSGGLFKSDRTLVTDIGTIEFSLRKALYETRDATTDYTHNWHRDDKPFLTFVFKYRSLVQTPSSQANASPSSSQGAISEIGANEVISLDKEEIIAMVTVYRGRDDGLAGQSKKSLLGLLKFYEKRSPVKSEPATDSTGSVRIKRECEDGGSVTGRRKRNKPETIVLDE